MQQMVSITSQGQLTIPSSMRKFLGIKGSTKAIIESKGSQLIVKPKSDFWSLSGSLASSVKLSDKQLKKARKNFSKDWAEHE